MSEEAKIQPALSSEEWARRYAERFDEGSDCGLFSDGSRANRHWWIMRSSGQVFIGVDEAGARHPALGVVPTADHALAALCLHGQPFGFTWDDVDRLQWRINEMRRVAQPIGPLHAYWDGIFDLESIRDRIVALLPPRAS